MYTSSTPVLILFTTGITTHSPKDPKREEKLTNNQNMTHEKKIKSDVGSTHDKLDDLKIPVRNQNKLGQQHNTNQPTYPERPTPNQRREDSEEEQFAHIPASMA